MEANVDARTQGAFEESRFNASPTPAGCAQFDKCNRNRSQALPYPRLCFKEMLVFSASLAAKSNKEPSSGSMHLPSLPPDAPFLSLTPFRLRLLDGREKLAVAYTPLRKSARAPRSLAPFFVPRMLSNSRDTYFDL